MNTGVDKIYPTIQRSLVYQAGFLVQNPAHEVLRPSAVFLLP